MKEKLIKYILHSSFPCVMAKAVARNGNLKVLTIKNNYSTNIESFLSSMYEFIESFKKNPSRLSSFVLVLENQDLSFEGFEKKFWKFLEEINAHDKKLYPADPRVSADPRNDQFSFSLKSEAFFIIALHPHSPRKARRFPYPAIVFNPHQQFENMRRNGVFHKVRDMIRLKDKILQGSINPMLTDFGTRSEVFQYLGKIYSPNDPLPLHI